MPVTNHFIQAVGKNKSAHVTIKADKVSNSAYYLRNGIMQHQNLRNDMYEFLADCGFIVFKPGVSSISGSPMEWSGACNVLPYDEISACIVTGDCYILLSY